jgi:Tol biopolymer transport system component
LRETFKGLSIFSAMLMLLLLISTGCDVNIPGCGKRSLPSFEPVVQNTVSTNNLPTNNNPLPSKPAPSPQNPSNISSDLKVSDIPIKTPTPIPVDIEKIAYTTIEEGQPTLWTMNTDGTERNRLTPIGTSSWHPLWSPNGKILAFLSTVNAGKVNLYIVQKGSTQLTQLTNWEDMGKPDPAFLQAPFTWSPKSDQLAYIYKNQVWTVSLDTQDQSTLVSVDPAFTIISVAWAPHRDNKYIAYTVRRGVDYSSVLLVNPRLKDKLSLTDSRQLIPALTWTSDAETLAYLSGNKAVYTTTVEDTTSKPVIVDASPDLAPYVSFSPVESSSKLMLLAKQTVDDTGYRVAIVDQPAKTDQDTGKLKYLTPVGVDSAVWSPDGTKIAYVISGELWIMDSTSGLNKTRIALSGIQSPDWSKK